MGNKNSSIDKQLLTPHGLYNGKCGKWEVKQVRRAIIKRKLAPLYPPKSCPDGVGEECPICMMFYDGGLNRCTRCKQGLCTECLVQIVAPSKSAPACNCPFCNANPFTTVYRGPKTQEELQAEQSEERRVMELRRKSQREEELREQENLRAKVEHLAHQPTSSAPPSMTAPWHVPANRRIPSSISVNSAFLRATESRRNSEESVDHGLAQMVEILASHERTPMAISGLSEEQQMMLALELSIREHQAHVESSSAVSIPESDSDATLDNTPLPSAFTSGASPYDATPLSLDGSLIAASSGALFPFEEITESSLNARSAAGVVSPVIEIGIRSMDADAPVGSLTVETLEL